MKLVYIVCVTVTMGVTQYAVAQPSGNVPEVATNEIARRGSHVEQTGTIRSGLMAAAFHPPADDSDKWFLSVVYRPGEATSEQLRKIIETGPALKPWVDARDPAHSTMHYQLRSLNDATQADWMANLQPKLLRDGVPCVIIQPPRNGKFGKSEVIVKMIHGLPNGTTISEQAEALSSSLRTGIEQYVAAIATRQTDGIGVPPPFDARPKPRDDVPNAEEPVEWPPLPTPKVEPPLPPQTPAPSTPGMTLDYWTGALLILATIAGTLGATRLATWINGVVAFVRALNEMNRKNDPPQSVSKSRSRTDRGRS